MFRYTYYKYNILHENANFYKVKIGNNLKFRHGNRYAMVMKGDKLSQVTFKALYLLV